MWLLQIWKLINPITLLIYDANKEKQKSFDFKVKEGWSWGLPQTFLTMLKATARLCPPPVLGTVPKTAGLLHGCSSPASLGRPQACVQLAWEQDRETTESSFSCPTGSSNQICYIRCTDVLVSYYVIQKEKIFTFGSPKCKPRSLLVKLCLKTLSHIQSCLLTVAQLHIIHIQPWGTPLKCLCTAHENINCSVKAKKIRNCISVIYFSPKQFLKTLTDKPIAI